MTISATSKDGLMAGGLSMKDLDNIQKREREVFKGSKVNKLPLDNFPNFGKGK